MLQASKDGTPMEIESMSHHKSMFNSNQMNIARDRMIDRKIKSDISQEGNVTTTKGYYMDKSSISSQWMKPI